MLHELYASNLRFTKSPVFNSGQYLTRAKLTAIFRVLVRCLDIPIEHYASHSFRIGAATTAAEASLPPWLIQTLERWSSECFTLDIRTPPSVLQRVPNLLATACLSGRGIWNPNQGHCIASFSQGWQYLGCFWVHTYHFALHVAGWVGPFTHHHHLLSLPVACRRVCRCRPH